MTDCLQVDNLADFNKISDKQSVNVTSDVLSELYGVFCCCFLFCAWNSSRYLKEHNKPVHLTIICNDININILQKMYAEKFSQKLVKLFDRHLSILSVTSSTITVWFKRFSFSEKTACK